ncbi:hypothetical protein SEA_KARDASHIAN_54 [Streptomyces phage Kardashian]|nr:hypothetical protein SEA_KARDASHIAN_54 [Streptomyces phage Kardashian]
MRFALGFVVGVVAGPLVWGVTESLVPNTVHAKLLQKAYRLAENVNQWADGQARKIEEEETNK